jgi:hypothetical protein
VVFTVSGIDYFWDISAIDFRNGKQYSYEITVNKAIGITVTGGATWNSGNSYDNITGTSQTELIQQILTDATGEETLENPKQITFPLMAWNAEVKVALESKLASCYANLDLSDLTGIATWEQKEATLNRTVPEKIVNLVLPNSVTTIDGASLRTASQYGAHYIKPPNGKRDGSSDY